ncbi:MAG: heme exporter protein CcmB [Pseudomonadota bacterium]
MNSFAATFIRDLRVYLRRPGDLGGPVIFGFVVVCLFPLGIGPEPDQLSVLGPGVIWIVLLLASLLSVHLLFQRDDDEGVLEQQLLSPTSMYFLVLAKISAYWLVTGLPLVLVSPLMAQLMSLSWEGTAALTLSLLLGTPIVALFGGIGASLTIGLRGTSVLVAILILPLYVPILILGTAMTHSGANGESMMFHAASMAACLSLGCALVPMAVGAALRISAEN